MTWEDLLELIQYFENSPFHVENKLKTDETIRNAFKAFADELIKRDRKENGMASFVDPRVGFIFDTINEMLREVGVKQ